jgi:hypothetical protein
LLSTHPRSRMTIESYYDARKVQPGLDTIQNLVGSFFADSFGLWRCHHQLIYFVQLGLAIGTLTTTIFRYPVLCGAQSVGVRPLYLRSVAIQLLRRSVVLRSLCSLSLLLKPSSVCAGVNLGCI